MRKSLSTADVEDCSVIACARRVEDFGYMDKLFSVVLCFLYFRPAFQFIIFLVNRFRLLYFPCFRSVSLPSFWFFSSFAPSSSFNLHYAELYGGFIQIRPILCRMLLQRKENQILRAAL